MKRENARLRRAQSAQRGGSKTLTRHSDGGNERLGAENRKEQRDER